MLTFFSLGQLVRNKIDQCPNITTWSKLTYRRLLSTYSTFHEVKVYKIKQISTNHQKLTVYNNFAKLSTHFTLNLIGVRA